MNRTLFIRLLHHEDKGAALAYRIAALRERRADGDVYAVNPDSFLQVPNTPFCYWVTERIRRLFTELRPFESEGRIVQHGVSTKDDFRFVRAWWEVPANRILAGGLWAVDSTRRAENSRGTEKWSEDRIREFQTWCRRCTHKNKRWVPFAKGGEYSPFYADIYLVVDWKEEARELEASLLHKYPYLGESANWVLHRECEYFRPGLTWPRSTVKGLNVRILPQGCIFADKGPAGFASELSQVETIVALFNSECYQLLLGLQQGSRAWEIGTVQNTVVPNLSTVQCSVLTEKTRCTWALKRSIDTVVEISHAFVLPGLLQTASTSLFEGVAAWEALVVEKETEIARIQSEIDEVAFDLYGFTEDERQTVRSWSVAIEGNAGSGSETCEAKSGDETEVPSDPHAHTAALISWCVGVCLGRFDVRLAVDQSLAPVEPDPFAPLPVCPPGMLVGPDGLPAKPGGIVSEEWLRARPDANTLPPDGAVSKPTIPDSEYPLRINWDGILVDDPGFNGTRPHRDDIVRRVREVLDLLWGDRAQEVEQEACDILGVRDLRDYFRKPSGFFQDHLKRYSKSRRKAPIYWPLSTASGAYTIWLYYHRLTDQTLYAAVNKYLEPKIADTERELHRLEEELAAASGREATRLRDRLNEGRAFLGELQDLREELLRVAGLPYKPDLNDGVVINAAPLHRLFRLRSWAKVTEKVWEKLEKGDYDWAHMAYTIWPDRVREVCKRDRSIAIAHGLEDICEVEPPAPKRKGGRGRRRKEAAR